MQKAFQTKLEKALEIAKKTGDRLIVFDALNKDAFVVLNLDEYEKILGKKSNENNLLTVDNSVDNINRDIALWRDKENKELYFETEKNTPQVNQQKISKPEDDEDFYEQEDYYFNEEENQEENYRFSPRKNWQIPQERKKDAHSID